MCPVPAAAVDIAALAPACEGVHPCLVKVQQFQQGGAIVRGVELQPIELLGRRVEGLPPLSVDFTWPGSLLKELVALVPGLGYALLGSVNEDVPGYFDVEYLNNKLRGGVRPREGR